MIAPRFPKPSEVKWHLLANQTIREELRALYDAAPGKAQLKERDDLPARLRMAEERLAKTSEALAVLSRTLDTPTAAVILEPLLQGAGGMAVVRPQFLKAVQRLVHDAGALLIADEVLTGFGRCGDWFASRRAGLLALGRWDAFPAAAPGVPLRQIT